MTTGEGGTPPVGEPEGTEGEVDPGPANPEGHVEDELSELHDGALDPERARAVTAHLESCPRCGAAWKELEAAVSAVSALGKASLPPAFGDTVASTIRARSGGRFFSRRAGDRFPFERVALVGLVLLVVLYVFLRLRAPGAPLDPLRPHGTSGPASPPARDVVPRPEL